MYWAEEPQLMDAAEKLIGLANKLIAVLEGGSAEKYREICSPTEVWHVRRAGVGARFSFGLLHSDP